MHEKVTTSMPATLAGLVPDSWTMRFWESTRDGELVCAQCSACGTYRMPPTPFCHECLSQETEWPALSGEGVIYTFTIVRHAATQDLQEAVPYVLAVIDLVDAPGARLVANVVDVAPEEVTIGMPVSVALEQVDEHVTIPRFAPRHVGVTT